MAIGDRVIADYGFFKFSGAGVSVTYPTINVIPASVASGAQLHIIPSANGLGYHLIKQSVATA